MTKLAVGRWARDGIDWNGLRAIHRTVASGPPGVIDFQVKPWSTHAYVTRGAAAGPLGRELVLVSALPFPPFAQVLEALVKEASPAPSPYSVERRPLPETPFEALLFLPAGGEESPGVEGALGDALHVVPITGAERALAEQKIAALLDALDRALAFEGDPYRACSVDLPRRPPPRDPAVIDDLRAFHETHVRMAEELRNVREGELTLYCHTWEWLDLVGVRLPPGDRRSLWQAVEQMIAEAVAPFARVTAGPTVLFFAELIYVVLTTHPEAVALLDQAFDPRSPAARSEQEPSPESAMSKSADDVATAAGRFRPGEPLRGLRARARQAALEALLGVDPSYGIPTGGACWSAAFAAVYTELAEGVEPGRALAGSVDRLGGTEMLLEIDPDPRPPLVRLRELAVRVGAQLFMYYSLTKGARKRGAMH